MIDIKKQSTETRNQNTLNIDSVSTLEMMQKINNEDKEVALAVEKELENIAKAVDMATDSFLQGGRIIYTGAGTSGRIGVLDAYDCPATYGIEKDRILAIMAGGNEAITGSAEGAEDSYENGQKDLQNINLNKNDTIIALTASGNTPYALGAVDYANKIGAKTISVSNNKQAKIVPLVNLAINVITGAEAITGSTRMKAGTSQKLVLNMISTGIMIKVGKVYQNLMIDVRPLNQKLVQRVSSMIVEITNCTQEEAEKTLQEAKGNAKIAIIMLKKNLTVETAANKLLENNNRLNEALNK